MDEGEKNGRAFLAPRWRVPAATAAPSPVRAHTVAVATLGRLCSALSLFARSEACSTGAGGAGSFRFRGGGCGVRPRPWTFQAAMPTAFRLRRLLAAAAASCRHRAACLATSRPYSSIAI